MLEANLAACTWQINRAEVTVKHGANYDSYSPITGATATFGGPRSEARSPPALPRSDAGAAPRAHPHAAGESSDSE